MSVAQGTPPDLPGYCARTFTLMPVGFTSQRSVQVSGFADIGLLTPLRRLYPLPVRQASALPSASSRFAVARDTLAVQLTLLLAECVEDFHLQVRAPCRAHQKKRRIVGSAVKSCESRLALGGAGGETSNSKKHVRQLRTSRWSANCAAASSIETAVAHLGWWSAAAPCNGTQRIAAAVVTGPACHNS